jgi:5-methylcytosine-specific restriction protein A
MEQVMPARALRPCTHPGCSTLVPGGGRCPEHQQAATRAHDERRGSAASRGYDAVWRRLREHFLRRHPLCECEDCAGGDLRVTLAEVVDHVIPVAERPDLRLDPSNLRAMSKRCHDAHTARTRGYGRASTLGGDAEKTPASTRGTVRPAGNLSPRNPREDADGTPED